MNFICKEIQHHSYGVVGGTLKINPVTQEKFVSGKKPWSTEDVKVPQCNNDVIQTEIKVSHELHNSYIRKIGFVTQNYTPQSVCSTLLFFSFHTTLNFHILLMWRIG